MLEAEPERNPRRGVYGVRAGLGPASGRRSDPSICQGVRCAIGLPHGVRLRTAEPDPVTVGEDAHASVKFSAGIMLRMRQVRQPRPVAILPWILGETLGAALAVGAVAVAETRSRIFSFVIASALFMVGARVARDAARVLHAQAAAAAVTLRSREAVRIFAVHHFVFFAGVPLITTAAHSSTVPKALVAAVIALLLSGSMGLSIAIHRLFRANAAARPRTIWPWQAPVVWPWSGKSGEAADHAGGSG